MGEIVLIRHGQTEWSANGRHTSYTDLDLTAEGERQARRAGERLGERTFAAVISSPRKRAGANYRDRSATCSGSLPTTRRSANAFASCESRSTTT